MISVYNNRANVTMTDKELLQRLRIIPEFGLEQSHMNDTLPDTMSRFFPGCAPAAARKQLLEVAMGYDDEQHSNNAEPASNGCPVP